MSGLTTPSQQWSSRDICRVCGMGAGEQRIFIHCLRCRGGHHQTHSRPSAQPAQSLLIPFNSWAPPLFTPPGTVVLLAPLGFLVPPDESWSVVALPTPWTSGPSAAPRPSTHSTPLGSAFPVALPWSLLTPAPPQSSGTLAPPRSLNTAAPPWPPGT